MDDFSTLREKAQGLAARFQDDFELSNVTVCVPGSVTVSSELQPEFLLMCAPLVVYLAVVGLYMVVSAIVGARGPASARFGALN